MNNGEKMRDEIDPKIYPRGQHTVSRTKIDPDALKIMYRLVRHGYKAYLVGGGVRDVLLGKIPKDFDIATDATPRQIKTLFRNSRIIGRRFKLVHVFFPTGKNIEVSTFRDKSDYPQADEDDQAAIARDNNFGTEATDALRRDITINALFYDIATHSIIDYVGGISDLERGMICVIGDPDIRFVEDPVRLLRVVRHAARTGFQIEKRCFQSLARHREQLKNASQVRIFEEIKKDLVSGYCLPCLRLLHEAGILHMLFPLLEEANDRTLRDGTHLPICIERLDLKVREGEEISPTVVLTLIALYCPAPDSPNEGLQHFKTSEEFSEHLKHVFSRLVVPRKERERIEILASAFDKLLSFDGRNVKSSLGIRGEAVEDLAHLHFAVLGEYPDTETMRTLLQAPGKRKGKSERKHPQRRKKTTHHPKKEMHER